MTRTQKRIAIAGTAATAAAAVLLVGLFRDGGGEAQAVSVQPALAINRSWLAAGDTAGLVKTLVANVREHPGEARTYTLLGLAYQQRARETGNPIYYTKSGGVLARATMTP